MRTRTSSFFCLLVFVATVVLPGATTAQWLGPHSQLTDNALNAANSHPNPNSFVEIIGTTGGTKLFPDDNRYLQRGIIKNIRSFHLMELDFLHQFVPDDIPGRLKPHTCGCSFNTDACSNEETCGVTLEGQAGPSPFAQWKQRYCQWKTPGGIYDLNEVYASIEAIYVPSDVQGPNVPDDIVCGTVRGKGYPNKWYTRDEWGGTPAEIRRNSRNYASAFIESFCPADFSKPCVVDVMEIGSEPWGVDPGREAYHQIVWGIIEAMQQHYGSSDPSGWRMKLSTGAFIAHRSTPGCFGDSNQYIADMITAERDQFGRQMRDYFDFISVHNYAFTTNDLCFDQKIDEMPESPTGSFLNIKNMLVWSRLNMPARTRVNATEFGWNASNADAFCNFWIGEAAQAAYYMRAWLLGARYGLSKVFSYGTFDSTVEGTFCSTALIRGTPTFDDNDQIESDNRQPRLILNALDTSMRRIRDKHFLKVLSEQEQENGVMAYLLGDIDDTTGIGTPTHMVTWRARSFLGTTSGANFTDAYPAVDASAMRIRLPDTSMRVTSGANWFYLGWKQGTENDGLVSTTRGAIVSVAGDDTVDVRLSGLPLVVPIDPGSCRYSSNGVLQGCTGTPPPPPVPVGTCDALGFAASGSDIIVTGVNPDRSKIEVIGAGTGWQNEVVCADDCATTQSITGLIAGTYDVKVLMPDGNAFCFRNQEVSTAGGPTPPPPAPPPGGSGDANCSALAFSAGADSIRVENINTSNSRIELFGAGTGWQNSQICDGRCGNTRIITELVAGRYTVKVNLFGENGSHCFRQSDVDIDGSVTPPPPPEPPTPPVQQSSCEALDFAARDGGVRVTGLSGGEDSIEIIGAGTGWQNRLSCDQNCGAVHNIGNLSSGAYTVKVLLALGGGGFCFRQQAVTVGQ